ncbi:MAG: response regulator, partial [Caldimonas sp.]
MLRILVVEDNPDLRETLSLLLEAEGRHIEAVANAEDALRAFTAQAFDVVFTDVKLPGMSGLDLAARLRATDLPPW